MAAKRKITLARAERAASTISATWDKTLEGLKHHQPLIILSSLSLVVATFSQTVSSAAVAYAVSAAVAFMIGLACSLWRYVRPAKYTGGDFEFAATAMFSTIAGFAFLLFVAIEIGARYGLAGSFITVTIALFLLFAFGMATVQIWLMFGEHRPFVQMIAAIHMRRLTIGRYVFLGSYVAAVVLWAVVLSAPSTPSWWWVALIPFVGFAVGTWVLGRTLKRVVEATEKALSQRRAASKSDETEAGQTQL